MVDFFVVLSTLVNPGVVWWSVLSVLFGISWAWWLSGKRFFHVVLVLQMFLAIGVIALALPLLSGTDPSLIVLDEFVAVGFLLLLGRSVFNVSLGAICFGLLDSLKPFGLSSVELLPGSIGVVADDVVAALLVVLIFYCVQKAVHYILKNRNVLSS